MRTIQVSVYRFAELSDKAKQKAKDDYVSLFGYSSSAEALESIRKLAEHFDGKMTDWSIDWFGCSSPSRASFSMPDDMSKEEIGRRLSELGSYDQETGKGLGDCKLTGYCLDEDAIDGFRAAFKGGETDLDKLMHAAFRSLLKTCEADAEDQYTDKTFGEHCEANEYEFYKDGRLCNGND